MYGKENTSANIIKVINSYLVCCILYTGQRFCK